MGVKPFRSDSELDFLGFIPLWNSRHGSEAQNRGSVAVK